MKTVVCGVGSLLRADDGFGPRVVESLNEMDLKDVLLLDCASAPENFIGLIEKEKPDRIIVLDSADLGKPVGTVRQIPIESIKRHISTTHKMMM